MGPVNLDATREHQEERERLVLYSEQRPTSSERWTI